MRASGWLLGGVLVSFIGVALLTPLLARPVVGVLGRIFSWSVPGKLGRLNSGRNPRRTAITAAALMVGLALITGVNVVLTSATKSLHKTADNQVTADLIIAGDPGSAMPATFDPKVMDKVRAIPGVTGTAAEYRRDGQRQRQGAQRHRGARPRRLRRHVPGSPRPPERSRSPGPSEAVLDIDSATSQQLRSATPCRCSCPAARSTRSKSSVCTRRATSSAGYLVSSDLIKDFRVAQPSMGYVTVAPGTSVDAVKQQVDALLADSPEVTVADRSGYVDQLSAQFGTLLTMIQVLLALAILIAVLGIVNTLALSVLERTRELGLLRAIGMRRGADDADGDRRGGGDLGVRGAARAGRRCRARLGDGAGAEERGFSDLAFPWTTMATYLALAALVGVVAAVIPAIRAARVNVLAAIAHE